MYYLACKTNSDRIGLCTYLGSKEFQVVFHYLSLHQSPYMLKRQGKPEIELK
jgi:hypothetical protein